LRRCGASSFGAGLAGRAAKRAVSREPTESGMDR
jgi:hypothetical protein